MRRVEVSNPNSLNLVRFICACFVLFSHLDHIAGNSRDFLRSSGVYSVGIFFGLSGFLLCANTQKKVIGWEFLINRFLRIFPGFLVSLGVVAFVFAPLYKEVECNWTCNPFNSSMVEYFFQNITTIIRQFNITDTLQQSSIQNWNPPLWTLKYELSCYLILFLLAKLIRRSLLLIASLIFMSSSSVLLHVGAKDNFLESRFVNFRYFTLYFFVGVLFYFIRSIFVFRFLKILALITLAVVNYCFVHQNGFYGPRTFIFSIIFLVLALIFGFALKPVLFKNSDYSFGIYIYSSPVTHLVVLFFPNFLSNWTLYASIVFIVTMFLSWLSWVFIEKKALRFKR